MFSSPAAAPHHGGRSREAEEITSLCGGLNINLGTLNGNTIPSMFAAGKRANALGHPVVLDPVGAGASKLRTQTALRLLNDVSFTVIRGNISEIKALVSGTGSTRGVDACAADAVTEETLAATVQFAKRFARKPAPSSSLPGRLTSSRTEAVRSASATATP
jgi:hydroxyethylthiazole kinase